MGKRLRKYISELMAVIMTVLFCIGDASLQISFAADGRKIDVWDFSGDMEANTGLYTNNITQEVWQNTGKLKPDNSGGFIDAGDIVFGDLVMNHSANDIVNSSFTKASTKQYPDGYTASGYWYGNGDSSNGGRRYITLANVVAGDIVDVYMYSSGDGQLHFLNTDSGGQDDTLATKTTPEKYEFIAKYTGNYKIYTDTDAKKPCFSRVVRIPGVQVAGTIDLNSNSISGYTVVFNNTTTNEKTEAKLEGTKFSAVLAPGYTYTATMNGIAGYGFTNDTKKVTPDKSEVVKGKSGIKLKVVSKNSYQYTGKIIGFDLSYDISKLAVSMVPNSNSTEDAVKLTIKPDLTFHAVLSPDVDYTVSMRGVNDYEISGGGSIIASQDTNTDIQVVKKAVHAVTGGFLGLPSDKAVTEVQFVNVDDSYTYTGILTTAGYVADLRDGSYSVNATVDGYKTSTHVVVSGKDVSKDLLFTSVNSAVTPITWVPDIYVGYPDKANNYNTVNDAMKACAAMNPTSEAQRITVHIAPGTYREQVMVTAPYVTLAGDGQGQVLLTWYYGIGYQYYSIGTNGFYDEQNAHDQYNKNSAAKWGCSTYVKSSATGFRAENISFEASFNRYITDEEIKDGVQINGKTDIRFERKYGVNVTSRAATERSAAMGVEADNVEFYNCSFYGGQDTLYTGTPKQSSYYKNCLIEGNTDFIFGDGNVVFDGCNLQWKGYSDKNPIGGCLTAAMDSATNGYLFRNCTVTKNSELNVSSGAFGRPWGPKADVKFLNTKIQSTDTIQDKGWGDMSGPAKEANFGEYNTTVVDGTAVNTSKRVTGVMTQEAAQKIDVNEYLGTWTPKYFIKEDVSVAFVQNPSITDNGDLNTPFPGHTLTVNYSLGTANDANDASVIRWYKVNAAAGTETLVKATTVNVSRTYKIQKEDAGSYIKAVVIPETISGNKAAAKSVKTDAIVKDGYDDPSSGGGVEIGEGINIYLAGDSTVKDYSAVGMYTSGKAQFAGSWGEFLQDFFDQKGVTVQNYANGGRSSRSFINEGSLDKIAKNIKKGDYLFIQFGHNDSANSSNYLFDRFVPLGQPDSNGIYPSIPGIKVATPDGSVSQYGQEYYSYDSGGTYKWYLQQYIDTAKKAGAIPVLVTPVSRQYYNGEGKIKPHHDSTDTATGTQITSNNAYVTAVKQLASEQHVGLIDGFQMTRDVYEAAYKADSNASNGKSAIGYQVMDDGTHSNKLGGFISAALLARDIQSRGWDISASVKTPAQVLAESPDGQTIISVNGKSQITEVNASSKGDHVYDIASDYWRIVGQNLVNEIGSYTPPITEENADYTAVNVAIQSANALNPTDYADFSAVTAAVHAVQNGLKKSDQFKVDAMAKAIQDAIIALVKKDTSSPEKKSTIWIVGDSTVSSFNDKYYYPRYGWGTQIGNYLDGSFDIQNIALSGRSSKSYTANAQYKTLLSGMKSGDYVLIGFGHNDEKADETRYTNPNGTYRDTGSFANSLYENYIKEAQRAGCKIILVTPMVRRTGTGTWSDSNLHITATSGTYAGGNYSQAIRTLGTTLNIPVVDMTELTKNLYDTLGVSETLNLHAWTSKDSSSVDNTHTNIWGAKYNAYLITKAIKNQKVSGLAEHVLSAQPPAKADTLVPNPDYQDSGYSNNLPQSILWKDYGIWKGTVFGTIGGTPSTANQTLETDTNGNMHIAVANNKGKIASTSDGIAMYYYKVPANATFTLTAKAKINSFDTNDQVSFGLMARDDMYIDNNISDMLGDYVAAAPLKLTQTGTVWNCFARKGGVLTQGAGAVNPMKAGDIVDMSIAGTSDGYACKFGNEETVTGGFDIKLTKVDPEYVYVGMFVARNADITFSDIKLVVNDVEITPSQPGEHNNEVMVSKDQTSEQTNAQIKDKIHAVSKDGEIIVDVTAVPTASLPEAVAIAKDVFEAAAQSNVKITIKGDGYTWEFTGVTDKNTSGLISPQVTAGANIKQMQDKLTSASVDVSKLIQLEFEHSGYLPGAMNLVTLNLNSKLADGKVYLYYFNPETEKFELVNKNSELTIQNGSVQFSMEYLAQYYVLTSEVLPDSLTNSKNSNTDTGNEDIGNGSDNTSNDNGTQGNVDWINGNSNVNTDTDNSTGNNQANTVSASVKTGDAQPIMAYAWSFMISLALMFAGAKICNKKESEE